ncbi:3375_t:CDS:2 [Acaulospora morrowiae]|uniref:3375_t:CDS:1 n=1 Tax=Acaulospora morrowiae TaxID=94023 RepID=A0A9N9F2W3_9GLOM|nr:3375_t:CDS:2 [Acaulospora morrowiae]
MVYQPRLSPLTASLDVSSPSFRSEESSNNQDWLRRRQIGNYQDESSSLVDSFQSPFQARQISSQPQPTRFTSFPLEQQTQSNIASTPKDDFLTRTKATSQPQKQTPFLVQTPQQSVIRENETTLTPSTLKPPNVPVLQTSTPQQSLNTFQRLPSQGFLTAHSPITQNSQAFNNSFRIASQSSTAYINDPGKSVYSPELSGRPIGQTDSTTKPKQAESALVQTTPHPKPRQQQTSSNRPKGSPISFIIRELMIQQELPRNKYQDLVNNNTKLLLYYLCIMCFIFFLPSLKFHREFVETTLVKHYRMNLTSKLIYGAEILVFLYFAYHLCKLAYINYLWKQEDTRINIIREKIEKELAESEEAPVTNTPTSIPANYPNGTGITTSTTPNSSFVPNAWFPDGTPVPVQVPVSRYRIAPYVTPTKFSERLVNVKGVPALLPPDPDPDEGIEY